MTTLDTQPDDHPVADEADQSSAQRIAQHYDETPYTSNAFFYAAPGHIRATAHLYGVDTVPLERARVLELGCAAGGNLLPFALAYPNATVVGVDLSPVQIAAGQKAVAELGLTNLALHAMNMADIDATFGKFDYIISHGVFSWVPPEVRDAMLRICRDNLSDNGIAYLSYNTYPGWKAGDIVRDAMMLHSHGADNETDRLQRAKAMLGLLSDGLAASNPLAPSLKAAVNQLRRFSDYYIAHEYLEAFNTPCYFVEFVNAIDQAGLAYVGDAEAQSELSVSYGQNVQLQHSLVALGQPKVLRQQYLDFAVGRNFRKSLVVRADRAPAILATPQTERLRDLRVAGQFQETDPTPQTPPGNRVFTDRKGRQLYSRDAAVIAVMDALSQRWPGSLSHAELVAASRPALATDEDAVSAQVSRAVETLHRLGRLHLTREPLPAEDQPGPSLAPGLAYLAAQPQPSVIGTHNLWHDSIGLKLSPAELWLLQQHDGALKPASWRTALRDALHRGQFPGPKGESLQGQRNLDATAQGMVQRLLDLLKRQGMLMG